MSEEKKPEVKSEKDSKPGKPSRLQKILQWCKTLPQRIAKPFRNMFYELKKVTWPSKQKLISYSVIVLLFMLAMGIVVGLLDMGASAGVRSLVNAKASVTENAAKEAAEEVAEEEAEAAEDEAAATEEAAEEATEAPEEATEAPEEATEAPEEATEAPEEATEAPAEATEAPEEATEAPAESTEEN